jgi:hypothetical protein
VVRTSQTRRLLSLTTEPVSGLVSALPRRKRNVVGLLREHIVHELRSGNVGELRPSSNDALARVALATKRALALGALAEDEAEQHVEAADGKEEECRNEGEVIYVVCENLRTNTEV